MKHLLLVTCDTLADTGQISFSYIFNSDKSGNKETNAYDKYPDHCDGPFGIIKETDHEHQKWYIYAFIGGKGLLFAAPISCQDHERNKRTVEECFPDYFNLLCTKKTADAIKELLKEWVEVEILYFDHPILTS